MGPIVYYDSSDDDDTVFQRNEYVSKRKVDGDDTDSETPLTGRNQATSLRRKIREKLWLVPVVYTHFWISAVGILVVPYFPPLAHSRGIEPWKFGFVYSALKVGILAGSVLSERVSYILSPRAGYLSGQIGYIAANLLFGVLYWITDASTLLGLSMVFALAINATGALYCANIYAILMTIFRHRAGLFIAAMECLYGFGYLAGSWLGGALIDAWAFPLPFFVMSAFVASSLPFMAAIKPQWRREKDIEAEEDKKSLAKYCKLFLNPIFAVDMITAAIPLALTAFDEVTLEPYLRQFHLSSTREGSVFTVQALGYCIGAIIAGIFCLFKLEACFIFFGTSMCTIGYLIIGPAPFIPSRPDLHLIYMSEVLIGLGTASQFICGYMHALRTAIRIGYPDNIRTSSVVSSILFASLFLGSVGTSPLSGYLVGAFGYRKSSMAVSGILLVWVVVTCGLWVSECMQTAKKEERTKSDTEERATLVDIRKIENFR
ncbi:uncharacterized protein LOC135388090 [Ornithodoros turicata]|uniref:uncharacterized protein LOC135388090 n=1 Tax=Ornithodoros turicata TaxID=34597 RepID=UPI0031392CDD